MTAIESSLAGKMRLTDTGTTKPDGVINSSIGSLDAILLLTLWDLVFPCLAWRLGIATPAAFLVVTMILVLRNPSNGLRVLLLVFYTPAVTMGFFNTFSIVAAFTVALSGGNGNPYSILPGRSAREISSRF